MSTPKNLFYTKEHEWADFKDEEIIIGITDYAQSQLGDVIFIEFPDVGDEFNSGDVFGEVEACLLYTSPSPRDATLSRMPSSA